MLNFCTFYIKNELFIRLQLTYPKLTVEDNQMYLQKALNKHAFIDKGIALVINVMKCVVDTYTISQA